MVRVLSVDRIFMIVLPKSSRNKSGKLERINEHGHFESIGSDVKFQFFSTPVTSTCRMNMRVGAIDRYTLPICGKNTELVCRTSQFFFWDAKVENFVIFLIFDLRNFWNLPFWSIENLQNFQLWRPRKKIERSCILIPYFSHI